MVVFSNFSVVYFGLNHSSLFCVILVSGRRRIYIYSVEGLMSLRFNAGTTWPSPPRSRRDQSDHHFLNMVNQRTYF